MLCKDLDKLFQLVLQPNNPCMMMTGGFCRSSAVDSGGYDEYDIFTGTGLVASGRRLLNGAREFFNRHVRDRLALDLIMVQLRRM
jgi:hypothetical protein